MIELINSDHNTEIDIFDDDRVINDQYDVFIINDWMEDGTLSLLLLLNDTIWAVEFIRNGGDESNSIVISFDFKFKFPIESLNILLDIDIRRTDNDDIPFNVTVPMGNKTNKLECKRGDEGLDSFLMFSFIHLCLSNDTWSWSIQNQCCHTGW